MLNLTFGEQVKIVLSRKGKTIKELAQQIEDSTGKKMSRQNLTQRLSRDNFQEQDMRMIAEILGCPLHLSILEDSTGNETISNKKIEENRIEIPVEEPEILSEVAEESVEVAAEAVTVVKEPAIMVEAADEPMDNERDITVGELVDIGRELDAMEHPQTEEEPEDAEAVTETVQVQTYAEPVFAEEAEEESACEEPQEYVDEINEEPQAYAESVYGEEPLTEASYQEDVYDQGAYEEIEQAEAQPEESTYEDSEAEEEPSVAEILEEVEAMEAENQASRKQESQKEKSHSWKDYLKFRRKKDQPVEEDANQQEPEGEDIQEVMMQEEPYAEEAYEAEAVDEGYVEEVQQFAEKAEDTAAGEINPYTGREYESNSVRVHPKRIGYVQVYDRSEHTWTDMTEWAFLGYQERKKALLGKDYEPPIYLD